MDPANFLAFIFLIEVNVHLKTFFRDSARLCISEFANFACLPLNYHDDCATNPEQVSDKLCYLLKIVFGSYGLVFICISPVLSSSLSVPLLAFTISCVNSEQMITITSFEHSHSAKSLDLPSDLLLSLRGPNM